MTERKPYIQLSVTGFPGSRQAALWLIAPAVVKVAVAVAAIALSAQVAIPVPWSPVPLTLQSLAVLLAGFSLGLRLAPLAVLSYLGIGAAGWPVFASGSAGLAGPTGGYLVGFVLAAAFVGYRGGTERHRSTAASAGQAPGPQTLAPVSSRWLRSLMAAAGGTAIIFLCGVPWLALQLGISLDSALGIGFWPFLPDAALKIAVAVAAVQAVRRVPSTRNSKLETRN